MSNGSYFLRIGPTSFAPTPHSEGTWSPEDYHFSPLAGLMVHVIEKSRADDNQLQLSRMSFDILGRLPFDEVTIEVEVLRPGRTIELVQATAFIRERSVVTARAWYLTASDTSDVAAHEYDALPAPEDCPPSGFGEIWSGGFIDQLEARQAIPYRPGRGATWMTSPQQLVQDEEPIDIAEYFARIDAANGVGARQGPDSWIYPNVDLTVHLLRRPVGKWTGLDTTANWGETGTGITSSTLHDVLGPVGRAEQSLTVRRV